MMPQERREQKLKGVPQPSLLQVFGVCLLAVAAFFFGYEIVERAWLKGVNPEVLHTFHLLRGVSAAAITAALATLLFLRQIHGPAPSETLPPAARSWKRRLQHVSLRTKVVVPMVVLAVAPAMAVGTSTISRARESLRKSTVQRVEFDTASKARAVQEFLLAVQQDLRFLSQIKAVRDLAAAEAAGAPERVAVLRGEVEQEFLIFSQGKRAYYQVRYLNSAGHEVVRLNVRNGLPRIVPSRQLQDKSDRYYVKAAFALEPGQIYISPMDLNVEHGKVEVPYRGVVRFATPIEGNAGRGRGLVAINLYADHLLSLLGPLPPGTEAWLVDEEGTYLGYVGESEEKRDLYSLDKQRRLSADYTPEAVSAILRNQGSGEAMETARVLVSFAPIALDAEASKLRWTLMIAYPRAPIEAPIRHLTIFLLVGMVLVVAVASVLGVLVAHYLARPVSSLRRATREIAAGNLSKRVEITTGDEIEGLAIDFNTMTERLREAQERLSAWNVRLEQEVAHQTDHLHRLQTGLARADKLASIGQMTASVMHEIGNPLAAIKTKIQVAEEDGDLRGDCQALLSEIIKEVDRLATFLRSFSRLARLREPQVDNVSLAEVVQGVITLVTPELRRKGVSLRVESAADDPTIRADADRLRQLLINLILNAAEASPGGGEVLVRGQRMALASEGVGSSGGACIEVMDHGVGVPPEIIDKIWDPFFTTKPEGTGLGLAICRQIVQDYGGTIQVRSRPGEGTIVTLTFPAHSKPLEQQT